MIRNGKYKLVTIWREILLLRHQWPPENIKKLNIFLNEFYVAFAIHCTDSWLAMLAILSLWIKMKLPFLTFIFQSQSIWAREIKDPRLVCWVVHSKNNPVYSLQVNMTLGNVKCPNVSTTPITAMGCLQCLPLSVVQLKGKHCWKPHCLNGVVYTFGLKQAKNGFFVFLGYQGPCLNISTTPLWQWGFQQCLPFSWTTLRGKHCRHPIAVMGVVDTFGQSLL